jgi:hypothetical protein
MKTIQLFRTDIAVAHVLVDDADHLELDQYTWGLTDGEATRREGDNRLYIRNLVARWMGLDPEKTVFVTSDKLDCRRCNLQAFPPQVRGVKWNGLYQKWQVGIRTKSCLAHIGYYPDRNKAITALRSAGLARGVEWRDDEQMWSARLPSGDTLGSFNTLPDALNAIQEAEPIRPGVRWSDSKQKWQAETPSSDGPRLVGYYPDLDGAIAAIRAEEARTEELEYYRSLSWDKHHNMWKAMVPFGLRRIPTAVSFKTLAMAMTAWQEVREKCAEPTPPEPVYQSVVSHGNKWQARIAIDEDPIHLGYCSTPEEAETLHGNVKEKVLATIQAVCDPTTLRPMLDQVAPATSLPPHWSEATKCWLCRMKINGKNVLLGHSSTRKAAKEYTDTFFTTEAP